MRQDRTAAYSVFNIKLYYRPPYHWQHLQSFFSDRMIENLECSDEHSYGRTFTWHNKQESCKGQFKAFHNEKKHCFDVRIEIDNLHLLASVINNIQRMLDLNANSEIIEKCLASAGFMNRSSGLRLPGTWSVFEAGIRAILGQQISVVSARNLVTRVVHELGEKTNHDAVCSSFYFPAVHRIAESDFSFLKIPDKRKQTLNNLAMYYINAPYPDEADHWLALKGIGPWTVSYAKMRGLSDPDIYLGSDLGVKKAMAALQKNFDPKDTAPFRSYLTFQLWNQLS